MPSGDAGLAHLAVQEWCAFREEIMSRLHAKSPHRAGALGAGVAAVLAFGFIAASASAQTFGFATLQAGSLNHTSAAAIAKILKDKAGMNVLVQPTSGDTVILPMVDRGEADFGNGNIFEMHNAFEGQGPGGKLANLRIIGVMHTLRTGF
jgi:TRAP-type uncharacterized transport system substrate-binding protein